MPIEVELEALIARELRRSIALDGRSLEALGREAGFSSGYLSQLLRGRQHLKVRHIAKVLRVLGLRPSKFFQRVVDALGEPSGHLNVSRQLMNEESLREASPQPATEEERLSVVETRPEPKDIEEIEDLEGMVRRIVRHELGRPLPPEEIPVNTGSRVRHHSSPQVPEGEPRSQERSVETDPLESFRTRAGLTQDEFRAKLKQAKGWLQELLKIPAEERRKKASNAHVKYRGPVFYLLALEEARRRIPGEPKQALSLAEAVIAVIEKIAGKYPPDPEVHAPALAVRGNALRALGRIRAAEGDLLEATKLLESPAFGDPVTAAEVHSYLGSLRKDQGHLEEARHHLDLAATSYALLPDREKAARVLLTLSLVHYLAHDPQAAVVSTEEALALLDEGSEAWLRAYTRYNRAHHLHAAGETDRAEEELDTHEELLQDAGDEVSQHVVWLRARIAWSRSDLRAARRLFTEARKRARDRGIPWDAALVGLELALVELAEGRTERGRKLATEGLKVFAEQEVERESRAALELLEAAVRRDALTREVLERTVAAFEEGRHRRHVAGRVPP